MYVGSCIYVYVCMQAPAARVNAYGLPVLVDLDVWMKVYPMCLT